MTKDTGGPAFPQAKLNGMASIDENGNPTLHSDVAGGMTLRQYAAIKLRVPDSGTDWLDDMILEGRRMDCVQQCIAVEFGTPNIGIESKQGETPRDARLRYWVGMADSAGAAADAILAERAKQ